VLVAAHLGAFDYVGHTLSMRGYKVTSVTGRTAARFIFDAVTYLRRSHGASIVEATPSGVRRVIQALRRGECAAFLNDYDFFQNGRPVTFFGRRTTLPPGAVRIARDTGAAVVGTFARRTPSGYALTLVEPFTVEKTADLDADVDRGLARVVAMLERAIAATPDQWVMFQRVWPSAPADPVRVFPVGSPLESELLERVGAVLPRPRGGS
jgi:KDO2-lipid IV(A) lauroyltransferase